MNLIIWIVGALGLILDVVGFYGLFHHNDSFLSNMSRHDVKFLLNNFQRNLGVSVEKISNEVLADLKSEFNVEKEKRRMRYFWMVIAGFVLQFASLTISSINNSANISSNSATNTRTENVKCNIERCKTNH